jgi:zinc protease
MLKQFFLSAAIGALSLSGQSTDRTKAPETPPIPDYKLPPTYESKLPNGMAVVFVEDDRFPLVTARLNFQAGSRFDPKQTPGLAEAVAELLKSGTTTRSARQISEEADDVGGTVGATAGPDALTVMGNGLSEKLPTLLALMADISIHATFPADEVNLYKQNRLENLRLQKSDPGFLSEEKFAEVIFGSSGYAHMAPTEQAIAQLDPKVLSEFRDTYLVPNNATLILIGRLPDRTSLLNTVTQSFGAWPQKQLPPAPALELPKTHREIVLVNRPGSVQADIHVGQLAPTRLNPDAFPLTVGEAILGGGTNSRMFKNIREKEGFAYDAHSEYRPNREAASLRAVTEVRNEVIEPALKATLAELSDLSSPVKAEELSNTKNYLSGVYLLRLETQDGLARQLNTVKTLGLPIDYLETYTTRVRSVEPDQIEAVAKKYLDPNQAAIVVVGDAAKIGEPLKKFGPVTVVPANQ